MKMQTLLQMIAVLMCSCVVDFINDAQDRQYYEPRSTKIPAANVTKVHIKAAAGQLKVVGQSTLRDVCIEGTACAGSVERLEYVRLQTWRQGEEIWIVADLLEAGDRGKLDLTITVPVSVDLRVTDTSGEVLIENLAGDLYLEDSSGKIELTDIEGTVRLRDGSGSISVLQCGHDVIVESDGSGSISIVGVAGSVIIESDGSGSISVGDVRGNFVLKQDGSGSVRYWNIDGLVQLPTT
jgi:hypothetical protein